MAKLLSRPSRIRRARNLHPRRNEANSSTQTAAPRFQRSALRATMYPLQLTGTALLAALLVSNAAFANPQGGTVTAGSATIQAVTPQRLDIVQTTNKAIINWKGFSIGAGEQTNFKQPSAGSVTLNRVTGAQASLLEGKLTANGQVMLINPNGVVIGPNGRVDVGGLVATTANIRDQDFLAGKLEFNEASLNKNAGVTNAGHITVRGQGLAALVAPRVQNSGVIEAKLGSVILGGARTFKLDFQGDGLLSFSAGSEVADAPRDADGKPAKALVENSGRIEADGGTVVLAASAVKNVVDQVINTDGIIEARGIGSQNGRIVLTGGDDGAVQVAGTLDVSGATGSGGDVRIDGEHIELAANTRIDASGATGGGTVNIGGDDIHGKVADTVDVARGARIEANATQAGDGGIVTVLSAAKTKYSGAISARGGASSGDGGAVEVSSRDQLRIDGEVDLRAPNGRTGELLLDPATITITDGASGGSLDGNAGDGTVNGGDSDAGGNTISAGLLEGLAATANITLEATGLITVNAMADNLIDLQTNGGHTFTLRSTTSGGIRFLDANTEIRTQGGGISLQALGSGALTNIGKLTSNGGDIALTAGGGVQLSNTISAGAGNVTVTSLTNSIQSTPSGLLSGNRIAINAAYGNIGAVGAPINTNTANLSLATGGNIIVANNSVLSSLAIASVHTMNQGFAFQLTSPQLAFNVTDNGSLYSIGNITNGAPLTLNFSGDRGMVVGTVGAGAGTVTLVTPGAIADDGDPLTGITAQNLVLNAQGPIGNSGAALTTAIAALDARAKGGVYLDNTGPLNLLSLNNDSAARITTTGTLTLGTITSPQLDLTSSSGSILSASGVSITSQTLNLTAGGGSIGSLATPIRTTATQMSINASGDIYVNAAGGLSLGNSSSNGGVVNVTANNSLQLSALDSGTAGTVNLTSTTGSIFGNGSDPVTAASLTFTAAGGVNLNTAVATVAGTAGSDGITLDQTGALALSNLTTTGNLTVNASGGNVTLGAIKAGSNANITTTDGDILDDGNNATLLQAGAVTLNALLGDIGTNLAHLRTKASAITLSNGGNIFLDNDIPLETLIITNVHPTAGIAHTFAITVPYLRLDVVDNGTQFTIDEITGLTLDTLSFTGDQRIVLGRVHARGSVDIAATQGDLLDDGDADTRITGSSISLRADAGSLGTAATGGELDLNSTNVSAATAANIFLNDIADLNQLTVISTHGNPAANYQFVVTAPSLRFDVTDTGSGYTIGNISDATGMTLAFRGDRTITAHSVDVTRNGSLELTSTGGSVLDDGDKNTRLLASSVTLNSYADAVGSAVGNGYMDVVARTLNGQSVNGFTVRLPYPSNDQNASATTLSNINAGGALDIRLENGDLRFGSVFAGGSANLVANNGSLGLTGGTIYASDIQLTASDAIGAVNGIIQLNVPGSVTANAAGGGIFLHDSNSISLLSATATGPILVTSAGDITLGAVSAGTDSVSISADNALLDDGNSTTRVVGGLVDLSAQSGSLGTSGAAIGVTSDEVALVSGGDVYLDDNTGMIALSISGTGASASQLNTYNITAPGLTFSVVDDGSSVLLDGIDNTTALALVFSAQRTLVIGDVDTNNGSATLASIQGSIVDDGDALTSLAAPTVVLSAGNSIGASGAGNAIATNASSLTLNAFQNFYVDSSAALNTLSITSTAYSGLANNFGITAAGQTFTLSDNGALHHLQTATGAGLANFSFSGQKNIDVGTITGSGAVAITTAGSNSFIHMDGVGGSRITGASVLLDTKDTGGGTIGTSGTRIAVSTPVLTANSSGDVYITSNQSLSALTLDVHHPSNTNYVGSIQASNISSFTLTDGSTASLGNIVATNMDFTYTTDRAIQVGTINVGSGAVTLTTNGDYGSPSFTNPSITDDSNQGTRITAGSVSLNASNYRGAIGTSGAGDIDVTTANLSIKSPGDIYVSNNTTLTSLAIEASHSESGNRTYAVSATGLTFSVADQSLVGGGQGTAINNVAGTGLNFSFSSDRTLQVGTINVGSGTVALNSDFIQDDGNNSTKITANQLILSGGGAGSQSPSPTTEIDTTINSLVTDLDQSLFLINDGDLTFGANRVGQTAVITSLNGSLFADGASVFEATNLTLNAQNGSLGTVGTRLQVDTKTLTLYTGYDFFIDSLDDLSALTVSDIHDAVRTNTLSLNGKNLTFNIVDNGGNQYDLIQVDDLTGIDFTFTGDRELRLGALDAGAGNYLTLAATGIGQDIFDDGNIGTILRGGTISLASSGGSIGRVDPISVVTTNLALSTNVDFNVVDTLDLSSLSLYMSQAGATPGVYTLVAPNLIFNIADNGTATTVTDISDSTGLNLTLQTVHSQAIQVIDVQTHGTVSLISGNDIEGSGSPTARITAALASFETTTGGAIGTLANPIELSAPRVVLRATGDINIDSDTHIDNLTILNSHPAGFGTYVINSPSLTFNVVDGPSGVLINDITDTSGLTLTYLSDRDMTVDTINLGIAGDVSLGSYNGATMDLLGDGDPASVISAAGVTLNSQYGAVGATGAGNEIGVVAQHLSAYAGGGGVFATFGTDTVIDSISATASSEINNPGDIRLNSIDMAGNDLVVNSGGSILSGSVSRTSVLTLNAVGSVGTESAITTSAVGNGTTTLIVNAGGSVAVEESWSLNASSITAQGDVDLSSNYALSIGSIDAGSGIVTLATDQGSITGNSGANLITGSEVSMTANYGSGVRSIGTGGTAINTDTQKLTLNARGDMYVANTSDLDALSITRDSSPTGTSPGTLNISAQNLTFNVADNGTTTTVTNVTDTTGLDFTLLANDALAINTIDVGNSSDVVLSSVRNNGAGSISATGGTPLITADNLTLITGSLSGNQTGFIGTTGTPLRTAVSTLNATTQEGGIFIAQTGDVLLADMNSGGALRVVAASGDITVGTLVYGNNQALTLTATAGRLLDDGDTTTAINGSGSGAINLSAATGFGTTLAPVAINAFSPNTINATVTGTGDAHLQIDSSSTPNVNVTAANGSIDLRANGDMTLVSLVSTTDAAGNNVIVTGTSGDITVGTVTAGALNGLVDLQVGGSIFGRNNSNSVSGFTVGLNAPNGIGTLGTPLNVSGQNIVAFTNGGAVYLAPTATAVLGYVQTHGGLVRINGTADIVAGNIVTDGGAITLITSGNGARILAGNVDAGSGALTLTATNGSIIDDGLAFTSIIGGAANFTAATGIGLGNAPLATQIGSLTANVTGVGGIFIDEADALTLGNLTTTNGAITIEAPGLIDGAGTISAGNSGNIAITSTNDDVLLNSAINNLGGDANNAKVTITGDTIAVGAVSSTGDQQYLPDTGNVTIAGNLTGRSILIDGDLTLAGSGNRTFNTSALGGGITINGAVDGDTHGLTLNAGAGDVVLTNDATDLANMIVTAANVDVHSVTTTGAQSYTGNVNFNSSYDTNGGNFSVVGPVTYTSDLSVITDGGSATFSSTVDGPGDITIDADTGAVTFTGLVGGTTRVGDLLVETAGLTTFGDTVRAASITTDIPGTLSIVASTMNTTGIQSYGENLTLNNSKTFTGSTVTFRGDIDATTSGAQGLTITGNAAFEQNAGDNVALLSIAVTGNASFGGHVATTTTQTYGGIVTLIGDTTLDVGSGGLIFNDAVNGPHALIVNAGNSAVTFSDTVGSSVTRLGALAVNTAGATTFSGDVYAASIITDVPGTVALNAGTMNTSGTQTYGENVVLNRNIAFIGSTVGFTGTVEDSGTGLHALSITGDALFNSAVGGTAAPQTITVSGVATLNGGVVNSVGAQQYGGLVLGADTTLTGTSVAVAGAVDGTVSGQQALVVNGNASFGGSIGTSTPLEALTVNGSTVLGGSVSTANSQIYNGALTLSGDVTIDSGIGGVVFGGAVDGAHDLTVNAGSNAVTFSQPIGATQRLGALTVNTAGLTTFGDLYAQSVTTDGAGTIALTGSIMNTIGDQSYGENIILNGNTAFTGANVIFDGSVDDSSAGQHTLTVIGNAVFNNTVGAGTALQGVAITGTAAVNGGSVTSTGAQSYGALNLGADTTLTSTTIAVAGPTDGAFNLTVNGAGVFGGPVGGTAPLQSFAITGPVHLNGGVSTIGTQNYDGAITLDGDSVLNVGSGGLTLDVGIDGPHALTVSVGNEDAVFNGPIGGTNRLGALTVSSNAATVFNNTVRAASVATDVGGSVALNGGVVDTTAGQTYGENVTLGDNTTLTGSTVTFLGQLDDTTTGTHALQINGNAVFAERVGAIDALRTLSVTGTSAINGGSVTTTGDQAYAGTATLGGNTTFNTGGSITFGGSIVAGAAAPALNINARNGNVIVAGALGSMAAPLGRTVIVSGGDTAFGSVDVADLTLTAGRGTTAFNGPVNVLGGAIKITSQGGPVSFAAGAPIHAATGFDVNGPSPVFLGGNLSVNNGPISVSGRLSLPPGALSITTNGDITLAGVQGPATDLRMAAGTGYIRAGLRGAAPEDQVALRRLQVDSASGAAFYGTLGGRGGVIPATRVRGGLVGAPYFFNDTPWGPLELVDTLAVQAAAQDANTIRRQAMAADRGDSGEFVDGGIIQDLVAQRSDDILQVMPRHEACRPFDDTNRCEVRPAPNGVDRNL